jgi:hypothetical protein
MSREGDPVAHAREPRTAQLGQINVARLRYPIGAPQLREFTAALARINAVAEQSTGFVWRYPTDFGHLGGGELLDDPSLVINLSVWQSYDHLHAFTYRSAHGHFVRRRAEWFAQMSPPTTALWWVTAGHQPTPAEAVARLRHLRRYGPTARAFTVRRRFLPDGRPEPRRARGGAGSRR